MTKNFPDKSLDDQLAGFTEDLVGESGEKEMLVAKDPELAKLQRTVLRLQRAAGQVEPDPHVAAEMRRELVAEWYRAGMHQGAGRPDAPLWVQVRKRLAGLFTNRQSRLAWAAVATIVLLVVAMVAFPSSGGDNLPATAIGENILPIAVLTSLILGGLLFWSLRSRK